MMDCIFWEVQFHSTIITFGLATFFSVLGDALLHFHGGPATFDCNYVWSCFCGLEGTFVLWLIIISILDVLTIGYCSKFVSMNSLVLGLLFWNSVQED
nr:hypothetical protein CFP56_64223 [Quercus suber]